MRDFFTKKNLVLMIVLFLVSIAAIAAAGGKYDFPFTKRVLNVVIMPINSFFNNIALATSKTTNFVGSLLYTYEENQALKKEISILKQDQIQAKEAFAENIRLRELLNYKQSQSKYILLTAKVVGFNPSGIDGSIVIDKGKNDGVSKDMAIITIDGLVGTVVEPYKYSSRVQLILHPKIAVGGIVQRPDSRTAGIVQGDASNPYMPNMINLPRDADIIADDIIITSGFGGIYPKGIAIGKVASVANAEGGLLKYAIIKPAVDFNRLEEVFVITNTNTYKEQETSTQEKVGIRK